MTENDPDQPVEGDETTPIEEGDEVSADSQPVKGDETESLPLSAEHMGAIELVEEPALKEQPALEDSEQAQSESEEA